MATQATSSSPSSTSSPSSSSSCPRWKYDVFLSFCGVDTRKNFTDHLYNALKQKGIITFRDDEKLERGKYISPELLKAIEESKYAIIVLSTNYAFSRWCLIELTKIVECMKKTKLTVLPVFYHVDPSNVRNQRDTLAEAFAKHEEDTKVNTQDVQAWKAALKDVGHISGWHVHDRHESIVIQEILKKIIISQNSVFKDLVGIESRVDEMLNLYLDEGLGGVRFVGICGMGGMGKTTIAQEIFKRISGNFEATCFIANVREETTNQHLVSLQKQLLSKILMESDINIWNVSEGISAIGNRLCNKKVLIVLDDVDREEQLEALAGKHDWFGLGSRIIVTSRDRHLLRRHEVDDVYTTKGLNDDEALELFSRRAFKNPHPEENYAKLSKDFVRCANGLPLALNVLGNSLFDKTMDEWKSALDKLKIELDGNIMKILQISFDGLMDTEKELFLDIACFFKGKKKDFMRDILESFGYHPDCNIRVLMDKSLITIEENGILWMHDLLQKLGQEIVRCESPKEPGERSRLWIYKDVLHVLQKNTGTEVVEGIMLKISIQKEEHINYEVFSKMKKLRLLKINFVQPQHGLIRGNVQLPKSLNYLSDELRIIEWHGYPFKSMPTSFQPNKLVELRMRFSCIKNLWKGIMNLGELRLIDLSDSQNLIEMPDLSGAPKLRQGDEPDYGIMIPGREISKWFSHQSVGTSVSLQVPSDKLKGVVVCALFVLRQHHPLHELPSDNGYIFTHGLQWYLKANGYESHPITTFHFSEQFGKIESYHLYLRYYPYKLFDQILKENRSQVDANGLGQIEIGFKTIGPGLEVTKCGARWVYEQDIEDLNQTMRGCSSGSSCSITPYEDDLEDSAKGTKTK